MPLAAVGEPSGLPLLVRGVTLGPELIQLRQYTNPWFRMHHPGHGLPRRHDWRAVAPLLTAVSLGGQWGPSCRRHAEGNGRRRCRVFRGATAVDPAAAVKEALAQKEAEYRNKRMAAQGPVSGDEIPKLATLPRCRFVGEDQLLDVSPPAEPGVRASVYAIFAPETGMLQHIGVSRSAAKSLRAHFARRPHLCGEYAVFDVRKPDRSLLDAIKNAWLQECGTPPGNDAGLEQVAWEAPINVRERLTAGECSDLAALPAGQTETALREHTRRVEAALVDAFEARGCQEQILFDTKLKAKGLLDLDTGAPIGLRRPEGGVAAAFKVVLRSPDGGEVSIECPPDVTILQAAEDAGVDLPSSCKSGACSACAAKVLTGIVDQSDQSFLDDAQKAAGYVMTCVCYPRSDLTVETNKKSEVA